MTLILPNDYKYAVATHNCISRTCKILFFINKLNLLSATSNLIATFLKGDAQFLFLCDPQKPTASHVYITFPRITQKILTKESRIVNYANRTIFYLFIIVKKNFAAQKNANKQLSPLMKFLCTKKS